MHTASTAIDFRANFKRSLLNRAVEAATTSNLKFNQNHWS